MKKRISLISCSVPFLCILLFSNSCGDRLRGKPTPPIPEIAGFYVSDQSHIWSKENRLKIQTLWIRKNAREELEFVNKTLVRLQFRLSENREEIKLRSGKLVTSGHELLFFESIFKELNRLYSGKNTSDPKHWDVKSFGPFVKVKEVGHILTDASGRSAEISANMNVIRFSDGESYRRIGSPLIGRINVNTGKSRKSFDNETAGVLFYELSPEMYPGKEGRKYVLGFFSTTDDLSVDMPVTVGNVPGTVAEIFEHLAVVEIQPKSGASPSPLDPIRLVGSVDQKAASQKQGAEELIRRLKQDPNVSKEELIRELEKIKNR